MVDNRRIRLVLSDAAKQDLMRLNAQALKRPHGREAQLLEASLVMLHRLNGHRDPTKPLDFNPDFADLSDCDTTYVGADPYEKPPYRIVSRDIPPETPTGITRRQVIAIGERQGSEVYRIAGDRLRRPVGWTLDQLAARAAERRQAQASVQSRRLPEVVHDTTGADMEMAL